MNGSISLFNGTTDSQDKGGLTPVDVNANPVNKLQSVQRTVVFLYLMERLTLKTREG